MSTPSISSLDKHFSIPAGGSFGLAFGHLKNKVWNTFLFFFFFLIKKMLLMSVVFVDATIQAHKVTGCFASSVFPWIKALSLPATDKQILICCH